MRNMVIDAVLSILTVISIFAVVNNASANARIEVLRKSGAVTMTAGERVEIHYPTWSASVDPRMQSDRLRLIG